MKAYQYKMQWLCSKSEAVKILKIIDARAFTKITIRDLDLKILETYSNFIMYPAGVASDETINFIRRFFKNNPKAVWVELYRTN